MTVSRSRSRCASDHAAAHAAHAHHAAQPSAPGQVLIQAHHHFPQPAGMRVGHHESDVGGDRPDIADVVADAFQFQQDRPHDARARGKFDLRGGLDGLAERGSVREGRIARDALRQENGAMDGHVFEQLLGALVGIEHAQLQIQNRLAGHGEIEVAGLDDAGMDRSHRNLEDAFPQRGPVDVALSFERRQHLAQGKILAQGMNVGPVIVQRDAARIGMSAGFQAEPVLDFAFLPVHRGQVGGERRKTRLARHRSAPARSGNRARRAVRRHSSYKRRPRRQRDPRRRPSPAGIRTPQRRYSATGRTSGPRSPMETWSRPA